MQISVEFGNQICQLSCDSSLLINKLAQLATEKIFQDQVTKPDHLDFELYYRKKKLNGTSLVKGLFPDGSRLLLQREPCGMVDIALIFEDKRFITKVSAKCSLWQLLITVGESNQLDFVGRYSNEKYLMPVLVYMNRQVRLVLIQIETIQELLNISLASLGIKTGSGAFRLKFKESSLSSVEVADLIDANIQSEKPIVLARVNPEPKLNSNRATDLTTNATATLESSKLNIKETNPITKPDIPSTEIATAEMFYKPPPPGSVQHSTLLILTLVNLPDSFFHLSSAELQALLNSNQNSTDKPLMTQKLRDQEQALKEQKYPKTMIRVKFSNEYLYQATFYSSHHIEALYRAVSKIIDAAEFELYTSPPKQILERNQTFMKAKLAPATMVYITNGNLKPEFMEAAIAFPLPSQMQLEESTITPNRVENDQEFSAQNTAPSPPQQLKERKKGVPKWLKL